MIFELKERPERAQEAHLPGGCPAPDPVPEPAALARDWPTWLWKARGVGKTLFLRVGFSKMSTKGFAFRDFKGIFEGNP